MVDEVITKQELIDAQKDAQSLDDFINGGDEQIVVTRLLKEYPTLANAIRQIYEKGGKFYPTLAAANADIANIRTDVYVITGDNGAYYKATAGATSLTKSPYDPTSYMDRLYSFISRANVGRIEEGGGYYKNAASGKIYKEYLEHMLCHIVEVSVGEVYTYKNSSMVGVSHFITDKDGNVLEALPLLRDEPQAKSLEIPPNGTRLYVNRNKNFTSFVFHADLKTFIELSGEINGLSGEIIELHKDVEHLEELDEALREVVINPIPEQGGGYYKNSSGKIYKEPLAQLQCYIINVTEGDLLTYKNSSMTSVYHYFTDAEGVVLDDEVLLSSTTSRTIKAPEGSSKVYINSRVTYTNFRILRELPYLVTLKEDVDKQVEYLSGKIDSKNTVDFTIPERVREFYPQKPSYTGVVAEKLPNFYDLYKNKSKDVTVILTGSSLTQGSLYCTDHPDATTRPPNLHTTDLASYVYDSLIPSWDGQEFRRYDHEDLTYTGEGWEVLTSLSGVWDDPSAINHTNTIKESPASVSTKIPIGANRFNFVYRSDSECGDCTVTIAEGNGKVQAQADDGSWVEANGYVFSMLESPATDTKGNTIFQKRLNMRCASPDNSLNSLTEEKAITVSKNTASTRFNVVGFEWAKRSYMLFVMNAARGGWQWGHPTALPNSNLQITQDGDIWHHKPDLIMCETTVGNWGGPGDQSSDPLQFAYIANRAYFDAYGDNPNALLNKASQQSKTCEVMFFGGTCSAASVYHDRWDTTTGEPKMFRVTRTTYVDADQSVIDRIGMYKTVLDNYEAVEQFMTQDKKEYLYIPVINTFRKVTNKYYGSYFDGWQGSSKAGYTMTTDGTHPNSNGHALWANMICAVFDYL